ncbi:HNH endonuclease family protein [Streptosporangium sp. NBC_01810]|uniref:HNH endonuclease family protein n=1 Tax=Streptosporangium sp. NBC_01810 TaxID=2975951 RepID=UPI002DDB794D|nr:HNH endonuclease family protein [Streptosporangium sp. NBC_01810]WSA25042.1 HNH endonuclease family protein [Streptosporangium sp. NBC_01810]
MKILMLTGAVASALALSLPALATTAPAALPEPPSVTIARAELDQLKTAEPRPMAGYSRARFPHWSAQGSACNTREKVLAREGSYVLQDGQCRPVSGTWSSAYDGKTISYASHVDIDHMVPLANAWRSGAGDWTTAKRGEFANDLKNSQLIAVSAASNRSKGDQSPDLWRPPLVSYWCTYARAWTDVKFDYGLTVTEAERAALKEMLDTCGAE